MRDSKRALAEVAALLGVDTPTARTYLRAVQRLAGPVPYEQIAAVLRSVEDRSAESVARAMAGGT